MNPDYEYILEQDVPIKEQKMMEETKAILSIIFRDYWATPQQRNIIIEKEKYDMQEAEKKKIEKYGTEINFRNDNKEHFSQQNRNELVVYKENIFRKIINFLKNKIHKF